MTLFDSTPTPQPPQCMAEPQRSPTVHRDRIMSWLRSCMGSNPPDIRYLVRLSECYYDVDALAARKLLTSAEFRKLYMLLSSAHDLAFANSAAGCETFTAAAEDAVAILDGITG